MPLGKSISHYHFAYTSPIVNLYFTYTYSLDIYQLPHAIVTVSLEEVAPNGKDEIFPVNLMSEV